MKELQKDVYWQSAQQLSQILKESIRVSPGDADLILKVSSKQMREALQVMCQTLSFMEMDDVLYRRLEIAKRNGPGEVRAYLAEQKMNIDELFTRFLQFEKAINDDAKIDYDFGLLMLDSLISKQHLLQEAFVGNYSIEIDEIKRNVASVRQEVCKLLSNYRHDEGIIFGFIHGRVLSMAGVKIAVNNMALVGTFLLSQHVDLSVSVGGYMSEMAGGVLMMFPWLKGQE